MRPIYYNSDPREVWRLQDRLTAAGIRSKFAQPHTFGRLYRLEVRPRHAVRAGAIVGRHVGLNEARADAGQEA
jgi:hypothetical protein